MQCFGGGATSGQRLGGEDNYVGVGEEPRGGGGGSSNNTPDRGVARSNALAAAEARQKEGTLRGVQGNKPKIASTARPESAGRTNTPDYGEKSTWN